jgi:hypothetical protein
MIGTLAVCYTSGNPVVEEIGQTLFSVCCITIIIVVSITRKI